MLGEAKAEDQLRVEGRRREPRRRDEEDRTDLLWPGPHPVERPSRGLLGEVEGVLDVEGVLLGKAVVPLEPPYGHAEMAVVDVDVVEDRQKTLEVAFPAREHAPGKRLRLLLSDPVGRQGCGDGEDGWVASDQGFPNGVSLARPGSVALSGSGSGVWQVLRK